MNIITDEFTEEECHDLNVQSFQEAYFYGVLRDFGNIVQERGIGAVMAALDDSIVFEIYRHMGVDPE